MKAKKIIALLASMSLLLVAVLVPMMSASAEGEKYTAAISTTQQTADVTEDVSVTIAVTSTEEGATVFASGQMTITYDAEKLEYVGIDGLGDQGDVNDDDGTLIISDYGEDNTLGEAVYTITFKAIEEGDAIVTLDKAAFSTAENAELNNLDVAAIPEDKKSVTVTLSYRYTVTLPTDILAGSGSVLKNNDYTFSWTPDGEHYDYTVSAKMGDEDAVVIDNENGTYTIEDVTANLVITASRTEKQFDVEIEGETTGNEGNTATYNDDYTFTIPANKAPDLTDGYTYSVAITIGETPYKDFGLSEDGLTYTIHGTDIVNDIEITITKNKLDATQVTITVGGDIPGQITLEDAEGKTLNSGDPVNKNTTVKVGLAKDEGYIYTVTVDGVLVDEFPHTITVTANVEITANRVLDTETAKVYTYLELDGSMMWLITISGIKNAENQTYTYNGAPMYWSDRYGAYCTLVVGENSPAIGTEKFTIVDDPAAEVDYGMDVNNSGDLDTNDAQLVYNMYIKKYDGFTDNVTLAKFLRADLNKDKTVDVEDAEAIVYAVLNP